MIPAGSTSVKLKGLLSFGVGLLACFVVGVTFLLKLITACFAFITIEYGLHLLEIPTLVQSIQKLITTLYRS